MRQMGTRDRVMADCFMVSPLENTGNDGGEGQSTMNATAMSASIKTGATGDETLGSRQKELKNLGFRVAGP